MNVFISWSGEKSHAVAKALAEWLPKVINAIKPWISSEMERGIPWNAKLTSEIRKSGAGIICLTPTNLHSDWILFEAGALSQALRNKLVCPFLVGIEPHDVKLPLGQFQCTRAEKGDIWKLLTTLDAKLERDALGTDRLRRAFESLWPEFEPQLKKLAQESAQVDDDFQVKTRVLDADRDFEVAEQAVREAKKRILIVANYTLSQQPNPDHNALIARSNYYSTLWKKVTEPGIEYDRIVQLPHRHADTMKYNRPFVSHLRECVEARDNKSSPAKNIGVFWCDKSQLLTSFLVIDYAIVFIEFYALVDLSDGNKCSQLDRGLVIEDQTGKIPNLFERMFNEVKRHSSSIELTDVLEFEKSLADLNDGKPVKERRQASGF